MITKKEVFKESGLRENLKIVLTNNSDDFTADDVDSALGAIGYAAKVSLRLRDSVIGSGLVLGNVMILDVFIPLGTSRSSDVLANEYQFKGLLQEYFDEGVEHKGAGVTLGGFGDVDFKFMSVSPARLVTVTFETEEDDETILHAIRQLGDKITLTQPK